MEFGYIMTRLVRKTFDGVYREVPLVNLKNSFKLWILFHHRKGGFRELYNIKCTLSVYTGPGCGLLTTR